MALTDTQFHVIIISGLLIIIWYLYNLADHMGMTLGSMLSMEGYSNPGTYYSNYAINSEYCPCRVPVSENIRYTHNTNTLLSVADNQLPTGTHQSDSVNQEFLPIM